MKNSLFTLVLLLLFFWSSEAQSIDIPLSEKSCKTIEITSDDKAVQLVDASNNKNISYKLFWKKQISLPPPFDIKALASDELAACSEEILKMMRDLTNEKDEVKVKQLTDAAKALKGPDVCVAKLKELVNKTKRPNISFPFNLAANQVITLTVRRVDSEKNDSTEWCYKLKTEEKTRWLTHYGLTYAPSFISKVDHYYSQDSTVANTYRVSKENKNGPKPWDNISATINFTYPFSGDPKGLDAGFTAGFGLNPSLQLSGHAGLSAIIGSNVILGTGIAFMQKQKLRGEFKENQIIKTNLNFDALHEKVWLPELYFTVGFRFNNNPFASKSSEAKSTKPAEPAK